MRAAAVKIPGSIDGAGSILLARQLLDDPAVHMVYARCPEGEGVAYAVQNRLKKAAAFQIVDAEEML